MSRSFGLLASAVLLVACGGGAGGSDALEANEASEHPEGSIRFATFNASLNRTAEGELLEHLATPDNEQARATARIIQHVAPDVLLLNEFDYDAEHRALELFAKNYLEVSQEGEAAIEYPYRYAAPSNTGLPSGKDLDNDGQVRGGGDAFGFGDFPGQYGFAVYSKYPIDEANLRTFQKFLWKDMPGAVFPDKPQTAKKNDWYSAGELAILRLSSKNHCDVPITIGERVVHFLVHHPTPPAFDGAEDRNGIRNRHEIRLFADYVTEGRGDYLVDDQGRAGGLTPGASFVLAGDHNSDPFDGDSQGVRQLLEHPRVNASFVPASEGAAEAAVLQGGVNAHHRGDPANDTGDFYDGKVGNLRLDYVLPSTDLEPAGGGVFWPKADDPLAPLIRHSDHRLVWIDLRLP